MPYTAENYSFANASNWRLPNIKELKYITEMACHSPAINETVFPDTIYETEFPATTYRTGDFYRTSSKEANTTYLVWLVQFKTGQATTTWAKYDDNDVSMSNKLPVRLVREGK